MKQHLPNDEELPSDVSQSAENLLNKFCDQEKINAVQ